MNLCWRCRYSLGLRNWRHRRILEIAEYGKKRIKATQLTKFSPLSLLWLWWRYKLWLWCGYGLGSFHARFRAIPQGLHRHVTGQYEDTFV
jgi:hypothetical protein